MPPEIKKNTINGESIVQEEQSCSTSSISEDKQKNRSPKSKKSSKKLVNSQLNLQQLTKAKIESKLQDFLLERFPKPRKTSVDFNKYIGNAEK